MNRKLALLGSIIAASSIFVVILEGVSEQYQAYQTQEIQLIYDQQGIDRSIGHPIRIRSR